MMIHSHRYWQPPALFLIAGFLQHVNLPRKTKDETTTSGTINISVDESFKPVIDSQVKVFEASWPNAKIITHYKPEADCIKDLNNDSIRMVIITSPLSRDEERPDEKPPGLCSAVMASWLPML